jgi:monoamine oxidase
LSRDTVDVVVVGAGVAGLAAAARLRAGGLNCVVLEAAARVGGRAYTTEIAGAAFDQGASWFHDADANPLTDIAQSCGDRLLDFSGRRTERIFIDGRLATSDELAESDTAEARVTAFLSRAAEEPDVSVAEAARPLAAEPWTATILAWEASVIAAADPDVLSVQDWHVNLLPGRNLVPDGGVGAFVARRLVGPAGDIRLSTPVSRIDASGRTVRIETSAGALEARAVIVTVSTGVLAAGAIRFDPALPVATQDAIAGLPMGLLSKVALPAAGADRLGLDAATSVYRRMGPGDPALVLNAWPLDLPYVVGFFGGRTAWAHVDAGAAESMVRAEWRALFGARADQALGGPAVVTDWGTNPLTLGAYAYARPGYADARRRLAETVFDGRLSFAGEACHVGLAGTVGGAYLSGVAAAERLLAGAF